MKWRLFAGAAILASGLLLKAGAPILSVLLGVGVAALWNRLRLRAIADKAKKQSPMLV